MQSCECEYDSKGSITYALDYSIKMLADFRKIKTTGPIVGKNGCTILSMTQRNRRAKIISTSGKSLSFQGCCSSDNCGDGNWACDGLHDGGRGLGAMRGGTFGLGGD
jgi:hypothetical protein